MKYDVVVLGGGHNGLVSAAYLAGAGRKVLVLEQRDRLGGLAAAEEFHPGFTAPGIWHDTAALRPAVVEELGLAQHGLTLREPPAVHGLQPGQPSLVLTRDDVRSAPGNGGVRDEDQSAYAEYRAFFDRVAPFVRRLADAPAPDMQPASLGQWWKLLGTGLALRRLGRRELTELLRLAPMCVADWLRERFTDPRLEALLAGPALTASWTGPWSPGTAANLLFHECLAGREVAGGPAAATAALEAACRAAGAELRTGAGVERILLQGGVVGGVELQSGERVETAALVATCDPRRTLLDLLASAEVPETLESEASVYRGTGTTAKLHLAIAGPFAVPGAGEPVERARTGAHLDELERAFDAVKYGQRSERPWLDIRVPSLAQPGLAPEGHHTLSILVHFAPWDLEGGWDDAAREALADAAVSELERHVPGVSGQVVARECLTPADLEKRYGLVRGHLHHGEHALDQRLGLRPFFSCGRHATPVGGLWLGGSGSHPGGGITGGPGRLAARALLAG